MTILKTLTFLAICLSISTFSSDQVSYTEKYGSPEIDIDELWESGEIFLDYEAKKKPWSSWWYPHKERELFFSATNEYSPLEKYMQVTGFNGVIAKEESFYDQGVVGTSDWEGLCQAWALASIIESEPKRPVTKKGVTFSVADQKALILKSYENILEGQEFFGERYRNARSDYDDLDPVDFHSMLIQELKKGNSFIMDHEAGVEVWNVPVYKVSIEMREDPFEGDRIMVTAYVTTAESLNVDKNFIGTQGEERIYYYSLYYGEEDGKYVAFSGQWEDESEDIHPDFLIKVHPKEVKTESFNDLVKKSAIKDILR